MIEVRFHGRGGQGAVTSAELVAMAAIDEGRYAQAFPSFGPERRGAPLQAFLRISDSPIRLRERIIFPDMVVVLDSALITTVNLEEGLKRDGVLVINSFRSIKLIRRKCKFLGRIAIVDANKIAKEELGLPITNTTMLGALLKATENIGGIVKIQSIEKYFNIRFGINFIKNFKALNRAYRETYIDEV